MCVCVCVYVCVCVCVCRYVEIASGSIKTDVALWKVNSVGDIWGLSYIANMCHYVCDVQWVSDSRPQSRAASVKVDANKFAPQGANPNELRDKVLEVKST